MLLVIRADGVKSRSETSLWEGPATRLREMLRIGELVSHASLPQLRPLVLALQ